MTERTRRARPLSEAEIALWLSVAETVIARKDAVLPRARPVLPPPPAAAGPTNFSAERRSDGDPAGRSSKPRPAPPLAPFEKRYRRLVTRGRVAIDGAIDLHGLNQAEAHRALHGFLSASQQAGGRLVLVVTGKGRPRTAHGPPTFDREPGVLRRAVPGWLREQALRTIVLGFEEAGLPHGGMGALYIRLRKRSP